MSEAKKPHLDLGEVMPTPVPIKLTDVVTGIELNEEEVKHSVEIYKEFHSQTASPQRIGLYGEDLEKALRANDSVLIEYDGRVGERVFAPILVPAEHLYWFNMDLLRRTYGDTKEFLYFTHPPIPEDEEDKQRIAELIKSKIDNGAIIFTDQYSEAEKNKSILEMLGSEYLAEDLGGDSDRFLNEYISPYLFYSSGKNVIDTVSVPEVYSQLLESEEIAANKENGAQLLSVVPEDQIERLWQIYQNPFKKLGINNPVNAGYDRDSFFKAMKDPEFIKFVYLKNNEITSMTFLTTNIDKTPWLSEEWFQNKYPEYINTDNLYVFLGIVTDENLRGERHSLPLIEFMVEIASARKTDILLVFECNEISCEYIPALVKGAVEHTGLALLPEIEEVKSQIKFVALRK